MKEAHKGLAAMPAKRHGMTVSPAIDRFFRHRATEMAVMTAIILASFSALFSVIWDYPALEALNLFFSVLFAIELLLRFFTYGVSRGSGGKAAYFRDWWVDWVATVPWDRLLLLVVSVTAPQAVRLVRLVRLARVLRFRHAGRNGFLLLARYRLRRLVEGSMPRQLMVLALFSAFVVGSFAILFNVLGTEFGHGSNLWFSIISMFSSDSLFEVEAQTNGVKALVLVLSSVGIVVFNGILIAIIIGSLMTNLEELKKGHGEVREKGHVLLLGRSEFVPHILNELNTYCVVERIRSKRVVVMQYSSGMNDLPSAASLPRIEVIPRVGGAWSSESLDRLSLKEAMGVIVFGGVSESYDDQRFNDALVTKTLVSINSLLRTCPPEKDAPSVVLHYSDASRTLYARGYLERGEARVQPVFFDPVFYTAKLISCLCANPYSYAIYNELLSAEGSEFHSVRLSLPGGAPFGSLMLLFPMGIPMGFRNGGACNLVPSDDQIVPDGSDVLVLAPSSYDARRIDAGPRECHSADKPLPPLKLEDGVVIVGVNDKLPRIVEGLQRQGRRKILVIDNQSGGSFAQWYSARRCTDEQALLNPPAFAECHFRSASEIGSAITFDRVSTVVILADGLLLNSATPEQIDADTFSRLLMIQHLLETSGKGRTEDVHLIVEVLTRDTEAVVSEFKHCSHIVGPLFIGRLLTTFMLYPHLEESFRRLLQTGDVDINCRTSEEMRKTLPGLPRNGLVFADLLRHRPRGCIPLGWVTEEDSGRPVRLNPSRNEPLPPGALIICMERTDITEAVLPLSR
jgi:hypothetical protein